MIKIARINDRQEYYRGDSRYVYGIYNTCAKKFQFGIKEDTPMLAEARLYQKIGDDARKWRFEVRRIPIREAIADIIARNIEES